MVRFFKFFGLIFIAVLFAAFAVSNRELVEFSLFPLPYTAEMPLFLLVMVTFLLGVGVSALVATFSFMGRKLEFVSMKRRLEALENEVGGLRAERNVLPSSFPPQA